MSPVWITLSYLVSAVFFILGLKGMTRPKTAVRGNLFGSIGMLIAVVSTLLAAEVVSFVWIIVGVLIGSGVGAYFAITIKMEKMPEDGGAL